MNKLLDLRFVIGLFFTVVGGLLIIYGLTSGVQEENAVNVWCGSVFALFGAVMIVLSFRKDAHDELLKED